MHVILHAADLESLHVVLSGDASQILPDAIFDGRFDPTFAILGAEDDVEVKAGVGVRHRIPHGIGRDQASLRDAIAVPLIPRR
jgi:hypothetical protein